MNRVSLSFEDVHLFRKIFSVFLILLIVFSILSRLSFHLNDIEYFSYPPQRPAHNLCGTLGAYLSFSLIFVFGEAFWCFPFILSLLCVMVLFGDRFDWFKFCYGNLIIYPTVAVMIYVLTQNKPAWAPSYGGTFGYTYGSYALKYIGVAGTWILLISFLLISFWLLDVVKAFQLFFHQFKITPLESLPTQTQTSTLEKDLGVVPVAPVPESPPVVENNPEEEAVPQMAVPEIPIVQKAVETPPPKAESKKTQVFKPRKDGEFVLPELTLLNPPINGTVDSDDFLKQRGQQLEEMFANFKIGCRVIGMERGPSITQFEMVIDDGIRVNKITGLSDNIALTLRAPSVRVVAPIPGRNTIGVEVPNIKKEMVNMRSIMESAECKVLVDQFQLPLILGKDVAGAPLISDLTKMPHLLVAGTTGSGKSVCINSIIISLIFYNLPSQVKLIMIDPKMVEMSGYQDIPHLMRPVITDMNEAAGVLEWACRRMDERYATLTKFRVRDIATFNRLSKAKIQETIGDEMNLEDIEWPMPYIVIIVDEFSDLMMVGAKEIEAYITRLAQKSRAVGIHVILATQRPSVDVITGLIKTNMPSRIAFQVAARIDSRTILDANGADKLLGKGDMLFLPPGTSSLIRSQGVMVGDEEIDNAVQYWKAQGEPEYVDLAVSSKIAPSGGGVSVGSDDDSGDEEIYLQATEVVLTSGRASASFIQRQLKVGYNKASRLIEMMEERGVVSPSKGSKGRDILMTLDDWKRSVGLEVDDFGDDVPEQEPS